MDIVAAQPVEDRRALFGETAERMGVASSVIVEKDFWVCFALHHLFALGFQPNPLFKGGTSLSKAYGLIERFSEDIDIALNRAELGFAGVNDPLVMATRKARERQIDALAAACGHAVRERLVPRLRASFRAVLGGEGWALDPVPRDDGQIDLGFRYPPSLSPEDYGGVSYIEPVVRMEIGARSDQEPWQLVAIRSYAAKHFPELFKRPETEVRVLAPERTFWEKATILHAECHRPPRAGRELPSAWRQISRHAYDIVMMDRRGVAERALSRLDLLAAVARHKDAFFPSGWARYHEAMPGSFRLLPGDELARALRRDYAEMAPMFMGEPPTFDEILHGLGDLEKRINRAR